MTTKSVEPSDAKIAKLRKALKEDIYWIVKYGPGFNPGIGANKNGKWHARIEGNKKCGVCAFAAYCLHRQPEYNVEDIDVDNLLNLVDPENDDVAVIALNFKMDYDWLGHVYYRVAEQDNLSKRERYPKGTQLGTELRDYGLELMEKRDDLQHEAAQEDQLYAERRFKIR